MELLISFIPTGILAVLLWRKERQVESILRVSELARHEQAEAAQRERAQLIALVQTPELAATITAPEPTDELLHVPFDDDAAYADYMEQRAAGEVR